MRIPQTLEQYEVIRVIQKSDQDLPRVLFGVHHKNGRYSEEILSVAIIEARILLWAESVQDDHTRLWRDRTGHENYRQYVNALVEAQAVTKQKLCFV